MLWILTYVKKKCSQTNHMTIKQFHQYTLGYMASDDDDDISIVCIS